jgi:hypothetical protein
MAGKLPLDAYEYYYGLGSDRSYQAVADYYQVSKRAVAKRALKENWQQKIAERETRIRDNIEKKSEESLEEMMDRHLRQVKAIQGRALEALKKMPLNTAMEAVRALGQAMAEERKIRGEPADRETQTVEAMIKREYENWLETDEEDSVALEGNEDIESVTTDVTET